MKAHIYAYRLGRSAEWRTRLTIGVQTFDISHPRVTEEEAVWMGDMLAKALTNAGVTDISREPPPKNNGEEG